MREIHPRFRVVAVLLGLLLPAGSGRSDVDAADALRRDIEGFVRARSEAPDLRVEVPPLADFALPGVAPSRIATELHASPTTPMHGSVPITVVRHVDGREAKRGVVTVRVEADRRVWVAARDLPRGTRIGPEDIRSERTSRPLPPGLVSDPGRLIGLRTTRTVRAGSPWRRELAREAPLVERGQWVRLRVSRGALSIETTGKAREAGNQGDTVRVLNTDSRREVVGQVGSDGVVHVAF